MSDPKIAQKSPFVMDVEPGKYAWCSCGLSSKQPYCDGSHKGTEFSPIIEKVTEARKVAWCGCKRTGKAPFCDGSHSKIE
jgi:CDGSH-type Zn-finger protein